MKFEWPSFSDDPHAFKKHVITIVDGACAGGSLNLRTAWFRECHFSDVGCIGCPNSSALSWSAHKENLLWTSADQCFDETSLHTERERLAITFRKSLPVTANAAQTREEIVAVQSVFTEA